MKKRNEALIEKINLKENAQFYKKAVGIHYSDNRIKKIFKDVAEDKVGNFLMDIVNYEYPGVPGRFSMCVFKTVNHPSFVSGPVPNSWLEHKLSYLLLLDFADYVIVFKKGITNSGSVEDGLVEISYKVLTTIFIEDDTIVEKVSLNNTSVLADAMRKRSMEAANLEQSMSTYGLGKYIAQSIRLRNASSKTSVAPSTSRITNSSEKVDICSLLVWAYDVIGKIEGYVERETFVDIFAEPVEYSEVRDDLVPISILVLTSELEDDYENGKIVDMEYRHRGLRKAISFAKIAARLSQSFDVSIEERDGQAKFILDPNKIKDAELVKDLHFITLYWRHGTKIYLTMADGSHKKLSTYLNRSNDYLINFEKLELVYNQKRLFKDRGLLNNVSGFIDVFEGDPGLVTVTDEKGEGRYTGGCIAFPVNSEFHYIDTQVLAGSDFSFLDDMGDEWADFIMLRGNRISFIHAKHDDSIMSASSFQIVVAQAMKNIGNFKPTADRLDSKAVNLANPYRIGGVNTGINKLRTGRNLNDAIAGYKVLMAHPNLQREILLVVDFISKAQLERHLDELRGGEAFRQRNQVIQILWLISGLVNCCMENGITIQILCKP